MFRYIKNHVNGLKNVGQLETQHFQLFNKVRDEKAAQLTIKQVNSALKLLFRQPPKVPIAKRETAFVKVLQNRNRVLSTRIQNLS